MHEGKEKEGDKTKLKNRYCFSGIYNESDNLWLEVSYDFIEESRAAHNHNLTSEDACTMCGSFCAMKIVEEAL